MSRVFKQVENLIEVPKDSKFEKIVISHLIESKKHYSIKAGLKDGKVYILEENEKDSSESDGQFIELIK